MPFIWLNVLGNPEDWNPHNCIFPYSRDKIYNQEINEVLIDLARSDENIRAYVKTREKKEEQVNRFWEKREDRQIQRQKMRKHYPLKRILKEIYGKENRGNWRIYQFANWAKKEELEFITNCILSEKDEEILSRLLRIFYSTPLPTFDPAFFRFTHSPNAEVRDVAWQLLSENSDHRVGDFYREMLKNIDYVRENLAMFAVFDQHFKEGDEEMIISVLEAINITPKQALSLHLYPGYHLPNSPGRVRLLLWLYEHHPCRSYRAGLTTHMLNINAFTEDIAIECLHDADSRTRRNAEFWLERSGITHLCRIRIDDLIIYS